MTSSITPHTMIMRMIVKVKVNCGFSTQTATGGDCRKAEQNRIGAAVQRTVSSGNWLTTTHKEANVSIGLIRATNMAKLANFTYFMNITNLPETNK